MTNIIKLEDIEPVRILGLDQDTKSIGWAKGLGPQYLDSGTRNFDGPRDKRMREIYKWLKAVLIEWRPALYILEDPMGDHENPDTHKVLGQVMGICKVAGWETMTPFMVITPYWIRQTGYYKETARAAALLAGKKRVSGHEADAIGAWLAGWIRYRNAKLGEQVETWKRNDNTTADP